MAQVNGHLSNGVIDGNPSLEPIHTPRPVKVICIGAGVSGIALAITMQNSITNFELEIFEKNNDIGGTWLENRYPGCACASINFRVLSR
jgi:cation diffusion facilitator CzcD-associated flavoprotein CzcO